MTERTAKILEFSVTRKNSRHERETECNHRRVTIDEHGGTVTCDDCEKPVSPVWYLGVIARQWERIARAQEAAEDKTRELEASTINMRAAKAIERAWRRPRRMAVCCPHCQGGILPEDMIRPDTVSDELERARRRKQEEQKR